MTGSRVFEPSARQQESKKLKVREFGLVNCLETPADLAAYLAVLAYETETIYPVVGGIRPRPSIQRRE